MPALAMTWEAHVPVVESLAPAPVVTYDAPAPVDEDVAPAPDARFNRIVEQLTYMLSCTEVTKNALSTPVCVGDTGFNTRRACQCEVVRVGDRQY